MLPLATNYLSIFSQDDKDIATNNVNLIFYVYTQTCLYFSTVLEVAFVHQSVSS